MRKTDRKMFAVQCVHVTWKDKPRQKLELGCELRLRLYVTRLWEQLQVVTKLFTYLKLKVVGCRSSVVQETVSPLKRTHNLTKISIKSTIIITTVSAGMIYNI